MRTKFLTALAFSMALLNRLRCSSIIVTPLKPVRAGRLVRLITLARGGPLIFFGIVSFADSVVRTAALRLSPSPLWPTEQLAPRFSPSLFGEDFGLCSASKIINFDG